ncbi:hydroxymethylpyrimidine/phosphomethylpyrimidine kinase [Shimia sp.]|uniref:bifunctional hydroxymethylpyrimidine kinase/phosphomethylpyrimidine kinase n=1 Tax=Shimia sp. TaxID=1954381 RepID=UPI00356852DE
MTAVLLIGGTDSSGGAGLTRDAATAHELGCIAKPVVTAVTAQTDRAVGEIHEVPAPVIAAQIAAAFDHTPPYAVKIGMVASAPAAAAIAAALRARAVTVILDPVLRASSGGALAAREFLAPLIAIADLVTPNLDEAAALSRLPVARSPADLERQAAALCGQGAGAVLIKGGHGQGPDCCDHLFDGAGQQVFCLPRLAQGRRGTGCTLATALACEIARGQELGAACARAKRYVHGWMVG